MLAGTVTAAESAPGQTPWVFKVVVTSGDGQLVAPVQKRGAKADPFFCWVWGLFVSSCS